MSNNIKQFYFLLMYLHFWPWKENCTQRNTLAEDNVGGKEYFYSLTKFRKHVLGFFLSYEKI